MRKKVEFVAIAYGRVEQATRNSEEDPRIDCEGETETETDVKKLRWVWPLGKGCTLAATCGLRCIGNLGPRKRKEAAP